MSTQPKTILKQVFGYSEFRPLQMEIIDNVVQKNDTMVIMPTGGGKSLCYQIPALLFEGLTLVISPLISLMKDQVEQLIELGVDALYLNSTLSRQEYRNNIKRIEQKKVKLVYLAPEALFTAKLLAFFEKFQIDCITVDEAHCISEWGHDFRPEYRQLVEVRKQFPAAVCVALTATATPRVQKDIRENLSFKDSNLFIGSFDRKNLFLQVVLKDNPLIQTIDFLKNYPNQSGIIYCFSRRQVDELTDVLTQQGFSVRAYHAGKSDEERKKNQEQFIKDDVQIIVATIAFGMGINKHNVRFVIHYDLPKNIESYYQEIGRAGRDGLDAHCLLLFSYADIQKIKYFIDQKEDHERRIANIHLNALVRFAETLNCRREPLLNYFGEKYSEKNCQTCDNCRAGEKQLTDISTPAQMFLSCIKRTGEIFGAHHIIDVLRGSESQKIFKFGHQNLSTYGIGKDYSKKQWFHMSRQFIQQGLIEQDMKVGSLKVSAKAFDVLNGVEKISGLIKEEKLKYTYKKEDHQEYDHVLFDLLKKERKGVADAANVPPYVIFPDKTLIEMAIYYPQSRDSLLSIHGIGQAKFNKYGSLFIDIIQNYCSKNQKTEQFNHKVNNTAVTLKTTKKPRHVVIGDEFNSGISIRQIQTNYKIKESTVIDHLYNYIQDKFVLNSSDEFKTLSSLSPQLHTDVILNFTVHGTEYLKPVFDELNGQVSYEKLRIMRLDFLTR